MAQPKAKALNQGADTSRLFAKILTVSDGVVAGTREDLTGVALAEILAEAGYSIVERRVVEDGAESVANALREMLADSGGQNSGERCFAGLLVTTGGTGFGPRDMTPEGTSKVIERFAPGLSEAMRLVNPLGRLSRGVAGTAGAALILNTPGSPKGASECLEAVLDVLPHALRLLSDDPTSH